MVIAVNALYFFRSPFKEYGFFTREIIQALMRQNPRHQFYIFYEAGHPCPFDMSENAKAIPLPFSHSTLFSRYWMDQKLAMGIKKVNADILIALNGMGSLTTTKPQCLLVHHLTAGAGKQFFYRRHLLRIYKKASSIAVVSAYLKEEIISHFKTSPEKLKVIYTGGKENFHPIHSSLHNAIKEEYTEGREFFLYNGPIHPQYPVVSLFKAFSLFKKRQRSAMKLVLAGPMLWNKADFLKLLHTYKYRDDVIVLSHLEEKECVRLFNAAYALVLPLQKEPSGELMVEALRCGVPALIPPDTALAEIGEDAALYIKPNDAADIADKMMLIYKDEDLRARFIQKGKELAGKYHWEQSAALLWQSIEEALNN